MNVLFNMGSQGLDSKIKGTRVVHFQLKGGVFKACSTPTLKGYKMFFYGEKEVEGVFYELASEFLHSSSDIIKFFVAEGV